MKSILVPLNFLNASENALRYTESVFKDQVSQLKLVYVAGEDDKRPDTEILEVFKKFEDKVLFGYPIPYTFTILRGALLDQIQNMINKEKPSLVVLGTSGTALSKALMKLTDCPVLLVPETTHKRKIRNIAYANDFNVVQSSSAFEPLLEISQHLDAKVHIIHVNKDENLTEDNAEASLEYYLQLIDHEYASICSKDFVRAIQEYVRDQNIDVLSVLLRDHGKNNLKSGGKLIEELVSQADIPVLSLV